MTGPSSTSEPPPTLPPRRTILPVLGLAVVLAVTVATQYIATHWNDAPPIGDPLFVWSRDMAFRIRLGSGILMIVACGAMLVHRPWWRWWLVGGSSCVLTYYCSDGPFYSPLQMFVWTIRSHHLSTATPIVHTAYAVGAITLCVTLILGLWIQRGHTKWDSRHSHGSARWGTGDRLRQPTGLLLGTLDRQPLRYHGDGHLVTIAPTRSGKGVSAIIPNLLSYPGSVIVTDPKGENYAVTARRRRELGTTVHAFDPFDAVGGTATWNPLDAIQLGNPDVIDDTRLLADMLVVVDGKESGEQAFWNEEARALLTGVMLYVIAHEPPERRTLSQVRALLTLPPTLWNELLTRMSASGAIHGMIARSAARILQKAEKERSGVISSAQAHTHFLDSPRMTRVLTTSNVPLTDITRQPTSCFFIVPPDRLETYQRWLRLMIATQLLTIVRARQHLEWPIVFFLDEFAHLGRLQPIARDMALLGGYGVTFWLFLQNLSQLRAVYGEQWTTFIANADVLQAFGTNDWETADYLSKMTGDATIHTTSENRSRGQAHGRHGSRHEGRGITHAERGRRLLLPDEVRRLDPARQLLFCNATDPILAQKLCYYAEPAYAGQFDANPLRHRV